MSRPTRGFTAPPGSRRPDQRPGTPSRGPRRPGLGHSAAVRGSQGPTAACFSVWPTPRHEMPKRAENGLASAATPPPPGPNNTGQDRAKRAERAGRAGTPRAAPARKKSRRWGSGRNFPGAKPRNNRGRSEGLTERQNHRTETASEPPRNRPHEEPPEAPHPGRKPAALEGLRKDAGPPP